MMHFLVLGTATYYKCLETRYSEDILMEKYKASE